MEEVNLIITICVLFVSIISLYFIIKQLKLTRNRADIDLLHEFFNKTGHFYQLFENVREVNKEESDINKILDKLNTSNSREAVRNIRIEAKKVYKLIKNKQLRELLLKLIKVSEKCSHLNLDDEEYAPAIKNTYKLLEEIRKCKNRMLS